MKSEFALAFNEIAERSKLSQEIIVEALEAALISAYRRSVNASTAQLVTAKVDPESGDVMVFAEKKSLTMCKTNAQRSISLLRKQ